MCLPSHTPPAPPIPIPLKPPVGAGLVPALCWPCPPLRIPLNLRHGQALCLPCRRFEGEGERRAWSAEGRHEAWPCRRLRGMGRGGHGQQRAGTRPAPTGGLRVRGSGDACGGAGGARAGGKARSERRGVRSARAGTRPAPTDALRRDGERRAWGRPARPHFVPGWLGKWLAAPGRRETGSRARQYGG